MKNKRIKMEREGKTGKGADMKFSEMNIRDPYIMKSRGNYYLYGTPELTVQAEP